VTVLHRFHGYRTEQLFHSAALRGLFGTVFRDTDEASGLVPVTQAGSAGSDCSTTLTMYIFGAAQPRRIDTTAQSRVKAFKDH
jgi:hypothetical protein